MWHVLGRGEMYTGCLLWRLEGRSPLGKPRRRREDCIGIDLKEIRRCRKMDYSCSEYDRWRAVVNRTMKLSVKTLGSS